jgi:FAD/FMN-containing dehydrogenase
MQQRNCAGWRYRAVIYIGIMNLPTSNTPVQSTLDLQLGTEVAGDRRDFLRQLGQAGAWTASALAGMPAIAAPNKGVAEASALRKKVRGTVIGQGDRAWPHWCEGMVWQQRKPTRRPPLIVRASNETDVIEAVRFAKRHGLKVAVRTGGHSIWATHMRDEGLLIDLSQLTRSSFNREDRSAVVQPALWGYHLIERAAPLGLAFPVAHCSQVALGGYLIGGGLGLNHDTWGQMACFGIEGADVVTASGELVTVDARQNADLYWAVRGAGQGFPGIVTKLHLKLQTRPQQVLASMYVLPLQRASEAVTWIEQAIGADPPSLEVLMLLAYGPSGQAVAIVIVNAFAASSDEAHASLAPFASSELAKTALFKMEGQSSSMEKVLEVSVNPMTGSGFGAQAVDVIWTARGSEAVAAAAHHIARAASPMTHAVIAFKSGRPLPADAACSRTDRVFVGLYSAWLGTEGNAANIAWLREASRALQPFASGHYINEIDVEATPQKAEQCFAPQAWRRLAEVRRQHDPDGLFHSFYGL